MTCRYPQKIKYPTRHDAAVARAAIKERHPDDYAPLYPYQCPGAKHWHLTHYEQGLGHCTLCGLGTPTWKSNSGWVVGAHLNYDREWCRGEGRLAKEAA